MIETRLTKLLGIKYPIIQGALGGVSEDPRFVSAVCNAGCLGILAACHLGAEGVRDAIFSIRELTDKPFGVNILTVNPQYEKVLEVCMEEAVAIFSHGRYNPVKSIAAAHKVNVVSIPTVGSLKHAIRAEEDGADALIVQGTEGGGHTGYVTTMVLIPTVVRKVRIPVAAAGGIATPEQGVAAICLGAEAIEMGTRFMLTEESPIHPNMKREMLKATEEDTIDTVHMSGRHQRWLLGPVVREKCVGKPNIRIEDNYWAFGPYAYKTSVEGDIERGAICCGQGVGLVDKILPVRELVEWMMQGMEKILKEKAHLVS